MRVPCCRSAPGRGWVRDPILRRTLPVVIPLVIAAGVVTLVLVVLGLVVTRLVTRPLSAVIEAMNDIAEAAGVTKPVLYQHFDSKSDLLSLHYDHAPDKDDGHSAAADPDAPAPGATEPSRSASGRSTQARSRSISSTPDSTDRSDAPASPIVRWILSIGTA